MPFLPPNQQCQSTEGSIIQWLCWWKNQRMLSSWFCCHVITSVRIVLDIHRFVSLCVAFEGWWARTSGSFVSTQPADWLTCRQWQAYNYAVHDKIWTGSGAWHTRFADCVSSCTVHLKYKHIVLPVRGLTLEPCLLLLCLLQIWCFQHNLHFACLEFCLDKWWDTSDLWR